MGTGKYVDLELSGLRTGSEDTAELIRKLEERALDVPDSRQQILEVLEEFANANGDSGIGKIASQAVERIAAVSMLEMLHYDSAL